MKAGLWGAAGRRQTRRDGHDGGGPLAEGKTIGVFKVLQRPSALFRGRRFEGFKTKKRIN